MKTAFYILFFLLLFSCSPDFKIKQDLGNYKKTFIEKSKYTPSPEEIERNKKINVVVLDFDFPGVSDKEDQKDSIGKYAASKIEGVLNSSGYINIIDRKISAKTKNEILLKEANGTLEYSGPREAQYAIYGKINNLNFSSEFDARTGANVAMGAASLAAMVGVAAAGGGGIYINAGSVIPAIYKYKVTVEGEVKVVDLKTLQEIVKIPFKEIEQSVENASSASGSTKAAKTFDLQMATRAIERGINKSRRTLLNAMPIITYVSGRMDWKPSKKPIFKINAGADYGIRQKWNIACEIISQQSDDLTGKIELNKIPVPGYITDVIYKDSAWIILDDGKMSQELKIGDRCLIAPDIRKLED